MGFCLANLVAHPSCPRCRGIMEWRSEHPDLLRDIPCPKKILIRKSDLLKHEHKDAK